MHQCIIFIEIILPKFINIVLNSYFLEQKSPKHKASMFIYAVIGTIKRLQNEMPTLYLTNIKINLLLPNF